MHSALLRLNMVFEIFITIYDIETSFRLTVNVLKFGTLVPCQKSLDEQGRPSSEADCF